MRYVRLVEMERSSEYCITDRSVTLAAACFVRCCFVVVVVGGGSGGGGDGCLFGVFCFCFCLFVVLVIFVCLFVLFLCFVLLLEGGGEGSLLK